MTGFGVAGAVHEGGRVVAEVRTVNGRFLDVRARLPRELGELTLFAEQVARRRLRRGRVELSVTTEGTIAKPPVLDLARARAALASLQALAAELAPGQAPPLSLLSVVPDLFVPIEGEARGSLRDAVERVVDEAVSAMLTMCDAEGEKLERDLLARNDRVIELLATIAARAERLPEDALARLGDRVKKLCEAHAVRVDPGRLEGELVLFAERCDVAEEITRLGAHLEHFREIITHEPAAPAIGRKLEFVLQEMVREINTLGSKAADAGVSRDVVAIKVELERMREQVQNVE